MVLSRLRFIILIATVACSFTLQASAPEGWMLAGSKPSDYDTGIDSQAMYHDAQSAYLKSKLPGLRAENGFGTLMQGFRADRYLGKRVRPSGFVRAEDVQGWAGLWMRVDKASTVVAFDNMEKRPIKGTSDWKRYEVVLDVPKDATGIAFGILLAGDGMVWLNSTNFEVVESNVPITGGGYDQRDSPTNIDFKN